MILSHLSMVVLSLGATIVKLGSNYYRKERYALG